MVSRDTNSNNSNMTQTNDNSVLQSQSDNVISKLCHTLPQIPPNTIQQLIQQFQAFPSSHETILIPPQNQPASHILSKLLPPKARQAPTSYNKSVTWCISTSILHTYPTENSSGASSLTNYIPLCIWWSTHEEKSRGHIKPTTSTCLPDTTITPSAWWKMDCTRLEGERTYLIQNEFWKNQQIADAFCGVGAPCLGSVMEKQCRMLANDWNPDAVEYSPGCIMLRAPGGMGWIQGRSKGSVV
ncbi:hypothetical protein ACHAW6_004729 [Cyclotella cf. meneghiniana]